MKAAYLEALGAPSVLKYGDRPDPIATAGEVLCDIHAATVNAADWQVRSGRYGNPVTTFPYILGRDFSGVVSSVGEGADLAVGDEVFGVLDTGHEGAYAEKVAIKASILAKKPASLSHLEAAAIALTGITAKISIEDTIGLKSGETILIHGGAGGVASVGIQIAKYLGARVITTASAANHDYVRSLGADEIIDYNATDFTSVVSNVDAVFDTVGGEVGERSFEVLRAGGRAAFIASGMHAPVPQRTDVTALRPAVLRDRPHLERILELVAAGAIKIPDIATYALSQAVQAHQLSESRHLKGKLVFKVK
ncbi:MAG: NADPH:quinone reductase-like Zn-dependent oxidoreductase [Gammaproteobacteria bacterium]|jgi:NADPH:quinone reductase-like Zn-dependent oxidoreductase